MKGSVRDRVAERQNAPVERALEPGADPAASAGKLGGAGPRSRRWLSSVARDLSVAQSLNPASRAAAGLKALQYRLHGLIHRHPPAGWRGVRDLVRDGVPGAVREIAGKILWTGVLMAASAIAGWCLIASFPSLISLVASEAMIEHVESGTLWTDGLINVMPSSLLSAQILSNNIVVSLFAVCSGVLFGLGTFYLIGLNGFMLGAIFAFVHQHGLAQRLFTFIIAHGMVELSVICIAGAMGAAIGDALIRSDTREPPGIVSLLRHPARSLDGVLRGIAGRRGGHRGLHLPRSGLSFMEPPDHRFPLLAAHGARAERPVAAGSRCDADGGRSRRR